MDNVPQGYSLCLYYLDDFLFAGPPGSTECEAALAIAIECCQISGVPIAVQMTVGPSTKITFLGIEIDSEEGLLSLPQEKLFHTKSIINTWCGRKKCTKRELLSLIGTLHHASTVVKPGQIFLRRMIKLSTVATQLHFTLHLNRSLQADLEWWASFLEQWNGTSILRVLGVSQHDLSLQTDASGCWGCGTVWDNQWSQLQWPKAWEKVDIAVKELLAIMLAAAAWGKHWQGCFVLFESDNNAVVCNINSGSSRHAHMVQLLHILHLIAAHHKFTYQARHLKGSLNITADFLSQNVVTGTFLHLFQGTLYPSPVPLDLLQILLPEAKNWLAVTWRQQFTNSITRV